MQAILEEKGTKLQFLGKGAGIYIHYLVLCKEDFCPLFPICSFLKKYVCVCIKSAVNLSSNYSIFVNVVPKKSSLEAFIEFQLFERKPAPTSQILVSK